MSFTCTDPEGQWIADRVVEAREARLERYLHEHYGPLWGEDNEAVVNVLRTELRFAYEAAGTPVDERRVDV